MILSNQLSENRTARELLQQFEPSGRQDGIKDGVVLDLQKENDNIILVIQKDGKECLKSVFQISKNHPYLDENQQLKREVYKLLSIYYQKKLPWGILTGVKPIRFYQKMRKAYPDRDTKEILMQEFLLSPEDAAFAEEIYKIQEKWIEQPQRDHLSLYIGIPVCPARCTYCSFVSTVLDPKRKLIDSYLPLLLEEIQRTAQILNAHPHIIDSVYIGGGTPSVLNAGEARQLIREIKQNFDLSNIKEFTFEAGRPDTISRELITVLEEEGVDRVCLNPQSMNEITLQNINRNYPSSKVNEIYEMIREESSAKINMDLILGLSDEGEDEFLNSLNKVIRMRPENLTVHNLSVKKGTKVKEMSGTGIKNRFRDEFFYEIRNRLKEAGYHPYYLYRQKYTLGNGENTGYTLNGDESFYNVMMMGEKQTIIGIGAGSSGKLYDPETDCFSRVYTVKDLRTYILRFEEIMEKKEETYKSFFQR